MFGGILASIVLVASLFGMLKFREEDFDKYENSNHAEDGDVHEEIKLTMQMKLAMQMEMSHCL